MKILCVLIIIIILILLTRVSCIPYSYTSNSIELSNKAKDGDKASNEIQVGAAEIKD